MTTLEFKEKLVSIISECNKVKGIGQTGDPNAPLISGQSDVDLFVLCTQVPSKQERLTMYRSLTNDYSELTMEVCQGGLWGCGDIFLSEGVDVMPMYFTIDEMQKYLNSVLSSGVRGCT